MLGDHKLLAHSNLGLTSVQCSSRGNIFNVSADPLTRRSVCLIGFRCSVYEKLMCFAEDKSLDTVTPRFVIYYVTCSSFTPLRLLFSWGFQLVS